MKDIISVYIEITKYILSNLNMGKFYWDQCLNCIFNTWHINASSEMLNIRFSTAVNQVRDTLNMKG